MRTSLTSIPAASGRTASEQRPAKAGGPFPRRRLRQRDQFHVVAMVSSRALRSDDHRRWYCPLFLPFAGDAISSPSKISAAVVTYTPVGMADSNVRGNVNLAHIKRLRSASLTHRRPRHLKYISRLPALQAAQYSKVTTVTAQTSPARRGRASRRPVGSAADQRMSHSVIGLDSRRQAPHVSTKPPRFP